MFGGHARGNTADSLLEARETLALRSATVPTDTLKWDFGNTTGGFTNEMSLTNGGLLSAASLSIAGSSSFLGSVAFGGDLTLTGGLNLRVDPMIVGTRSLVASECVIPCDATAGGFTVTLTASAVVGQVVVVSKTDSSSNAVTVAPGAGQSIVAGAGIVSGGNVLLTLTATTGTFIFVGSGLWVLQARI